jgi:hypothetical protein
MSPPPSGSKKKPPPIRRLTFKELHVVTSQKIQLFITTAMRRSNPTLLHPFTQKADLKFRILLSSYILVSSILSSSLSRFNQTSNIRTRVELMESVIIQFSVKSCLFGPGNSYSFVHTHYQNVFLPYQRPSCTHTHGTRHTAHKRILFNLFQYLQAKAKVRNSEFNLPDSFVVTLVYTFIGKRTDGYANPDA